MKNMRMCLVMVVLLSSQAIFASSVIAAEPPSLSTGVIRNSATTTVEMYLTGTSFNSFVHTTGYVADATDLAKMTYNGFHPISAIISEEGTTKRINATFPIAMGTGRSGNAFTIATGTLKNSQFQNNFISLSNANISDTARPILTQVAPITSLYDTTPDYSFMSSEVGVITYRHVLGDCISPTNSAIFGINTVTFQPLTYGLHANCTIRVTDSSNNASALLYVSPFSITLPVIFSISTSSTAVKNSAVACPVFDDTCR